MSIDIKKIKNLAAKDTVKEAKKELANLKKKKEKINPDKFEEFVKMLYEEKLNEYRKRYKF